MPNPKPSKKNTSSSSSSLSLSSSPSQFSHSLTKLAVTQILKSTGFKSSKSSALQTLTRITTLFIQFLAKSASSRANFSCSRSHCNIFDVIHAIEESSLAFGFNGASDINQTLLHSKTIDDLQLFCDDTDGVLPFSSFRLRSLRPFQTNSKVVFSGKLDFDDKNVDVRGSEIPRWLPQFPKIAKIEGVKVEDEKSLWEDTRVEYRPIMAAKPEKGKKENLLQGRRERVKFRLGKRKRDENVGCLDDLELRNGVCRGGKRVCLVKRVDSCLNFFNDDDEKEAISNGL